VVTLYWVFVCVCITGNLKDVETVDIQMMDYTEALKVDEDERLPI
jgi:hypothetical protein